VIARLLARLIAPREPPKVRVTQVSNQADKIRAKRDLRIVDAEIRTMRGRK
jgi:hypothetical protein